MRPHLETTCVTAVMWVCEYMIRALQLKVSDKDQSKAHQPRPSELEQLVNFWVRSFSDNGLVDLHLELSLPWEEKKEESICHRVYRKKEGLAQYANKLIIGRGSYIHTPCHAIDSHLGWWRLKMAGCYYKPIKGRSTVMFRLIFFGRNMSQCSSRRPCVSYHFYQRASSNLHQFKRKVHSLN